MRSRKLAVFWVSLVLLAGSFGGALHGLGDSLAVFRQLWAVLLSVASVLLLRGHLRVALLGFGAVALGITPMLAGYLQPLQATGGGYSLYQKNLLFKAENQTDIVTDILSREPDFVTLQEVSHENRVVCIANLEGSPFWSGNCSRSTSVGLFCRLSRDQKW